jgi:predicted DNA-binding helix-hairpin-helix protein
MNLEIPTESGLKLLAPDKNHQDMIKPMRFVKNG